MKSLKHYKELKEKRTSEKPDAKSMPKQKSSWSVSKTTRSKSSTQSSRIIRKRKVSGKHLKNDQTLKEVKSIATRNRRNKVKVKSLESLNSSKKVKFDDKEEESKDWIPIEKYGKAKEWTVFDCEWAKLTQWVEITIAELKYIFKQQKRDDVEEEEICSICRWELYDDLFKMTEKEIKSYQLKQMHDKTLINVVKFSNWMDHFYHKECAQMMLGDKSCVKWAIWGMIYGENIGDMPPGIMSWTYYQKGTYPWDGYQDYGTWIVSYSFKNGHRNGVRYRGTSRAGYIPDTPEGREVLWLLIKWFRRRHTFIVGDSVTTGAKNVVVWNSVHHKTNTHGGAAYYGYPDSTYLNRVKLEMADKGVILEESDRPNEIQQNGKIIVKD